MLHGEARVTVTGRDIIDPKYRIQFTSPKPESAVNAFAITVEGIGPAYADIEITGGAEDVGTETDRDGRFSVGVQLPENQKEFTLRARDQSGRYDSGNVHIVLDQDAPKVTSIKFTPDKPEAGSNVLLVVKTEKQADVRLTLNEQEFALQENAQTPGIYQTLVTAPDEAGDLQPVITVK
ncbi:MAG: hypothetical protein FD129_3228, partial [bacterium]